MDQVINDLINQLNLINQDIPQGVIHIEENVNHRQFINLANLEGQVLTIAGQQINVPPIQLSGQIRYVRIEGMQFGVQRVRHGNRQNCLAVEKRMTGPPGRPWRAVHTYGFLGRGGPQAGAVDKDGEERLYVIDEATAQAIRDMINRDNDIQNVVDAAQRLVEIGILLSGFEIDNPAMDQVFNLYYRIMLDIIYVIEILKLLEFIYEMAIVYNPRAFANQALPPVAMDLLEVQNVEHAMAVNMNSLIFLQMIRDSIDHSQDDMFAIDWVGLLTDRFSRFEHTITLEPGLHQVDIHYQNVHNVFNVQVFNEVNRIRLVSNRFTYVDLNPDFTHVPYYLVRNENAARLLVYRDDPDSPGNLIPVYSHGRNGANREIGCNGWQAMTLQRQDMNGNPEERLLFISRVMGAQLCQWFDEWDIMNVFHTWSTDLAGFSAYLLATQQFANGLDPEARDQLRDQLLDQRDWLEATRNALIVKYRAVKNLRKIYRFSVLVPDSPQQGVVMDQLRCLDAWPQNVLLGDPLEAGVAPRGRGRPRAQQQQQDDDDSGSTSDGQTDTADDAVVRRNKRRRN
ncbi:uncharacterized protein LOC128962896 [Oppia nitens]|uniref:uncharacterized protein LOC128962896 n=1 Tax=Oppia nitens TaxID=1686743 RepID=UPI0023DCD9F6|nr:uncharacterized protein LOC128962896 [Oppia nitens]